MLLKLGITPLDRWISILKTFVFVLRDGVKQNALFEALYFGSLHGPSLVQHLLRDVLLSIYQFCVHLYHLCLQVLESSTQGLLKLHGLRLVLI